MDGLYFYDSNEKVDISEIELIILDLDGTLYDISDVSEKIYNLEIDFFSKETGYTKKQSEEIFSKNFIFKDIDEKSKSATEFFHEYGLDSFKWKKIRDEYDYVNLININNAAKYEDVYKLRQISDVLLLSSNTRININRILTTINFGSDCFDDIICSSDVVGNFKKYNCVKEYCAKKRINTKKLLSIGDRLATDIIPVLEFGSIGLLMKNPKGFSVLSKQLSRKKIMSRLPYYQLVRFM